MKGNLPQMRAALCVFDLVDFHRRYNILCNTGCCTKSATDNVYILWNQVEKKAELHSKKYQKKRKKNHLFAIYILAADMLHVVLIACFCCSKVANKIK